MKLKNSNCDETKKNSNCDETQNLKLWQNSETQIVTKLKNSNCDKTQIMTKVELWQNSSCEKSQIVTKQIVTKVKLQ